MEKLPISRSARTKLKKIIGYLFYKFPKNIKSPYSGVVIAGFGESEIFPSLISYRIDGIFEDKMKYIIGIK